jgi:hypothetical protein
MQKKMPSEAERREMGYRKHICSLSIFPHPGLIKGATIQIREVHVANRNPPPIWKAQKKY